MARHRNPPAPVPLSRLMREAADSLRRGMASAPPGAQGKIAASLAKLAHGIAAQEKHEAETELSFEEMAAEQRAVDAEIGEAIAARAQERAQFMLNPPDWEMDNRAKKISQAEGGRWIDYLPRVHEEQGAFVARLLNPEIEDTVLRRWMREG